MNNDFEKGLETELRRGDKDLTSIVKEIEKFGEYYRETNDEKFKGVYDFFVELRILEAPKSEQYNLCDYWSRLTK